MPWYVADYLADTTHLTTEQHGAYCLLLMAAWKRAGRLPGDEEELAQIARLDAKKWAAHREKLLKFFKVDDGEYVQKRLSEEYAKAVRLYESKVENGRNGGRKPKRHESETKPVGSFSVNRSGGLDETQSQPRSTNVEEGVTRAGEACMEMRKAGVAAVNPSHPDLLALLQAGVEPSAFGDLAREILPGKSVAQPFPYLLTVMRGRLTAAPIAPSGAQPRRTVHDERAATIAAATGANRKPDERDITADSAVVG